MGARRAPPPARALRRTWRKARGRDETPSAGSIAGPSAKTTEAGGERGYDGSPFAERAAGEGWTVDVVGKLPGAGFTVLARRWVVERTFAWL